MNSQLFLELEVPVLYVNPPCNADPRLIEQVSTAGGLGIVDHVTAAAAPCRVDSDTPHGVRIHLAELQGWSAIGCVKAILLPLEDADAIGGLEPNALKNVPAPVLVEVGSGKEALAAARAGAAGLVARSCEGPGWVSETNGLVLLQEVLAVCDLPVFLQGGIGFRTAAGAMAAGAAGVVLDVHLLLTEESAIESSFRQFLASLGLPATTTLAEGLNRPLRVYSRVGTRMVRELKKQEESLGTDQKASYRERLGFLLSNFSASPDSDETLLPLSEDIVEAQRMAREYRSASAIVTELGRGMSTAASRWPFTEGSALCKDHGTRFPVVQGPMAHVSDSPDFLAAVLNAGALPFLALSNMPPPIAREALKLAAEKTHGTFGVGLIGLEVNRGCYEAHMEIMKECPPPFAILAAGSSDLALRIEALGTACYLHCPSPAILAEALKAGNRRFVFEGSESGGHIGLLGSLNLWTANMHELERAASEGIPLDEVAVLFAGGIATGRAAAFVAGMVSDLVSKGLKVGLQMGTAYLSCREAVSTCAITDTYQKLVLENDNTVVIGRSVNTRARAAGSPMAAKLIEREQNRVQEGVTLKERKELYEKDNLGALRLASKGCAIDPATATFDCPVFCELPPEEQLDRGLYLMGQVVSLLERPCTVENLHQQVMDEGCEIFGKTRSRCPAVVVIEEKTDRKADPMELEVEREPIAVVGIGLRFPGSDSPETFWDQIVTGRSGICEVPADRWENVDFYYNPDPKVPDRTYAKIGGFIRDFIFDPLKYRIPPAVAQKMDRSQQMAVACCGDALRDAGLAADDLKGKKVGIILGNSMGGEITDLYAARVVLPRTISRLKESIASLGLDAEAEEALIEAFRTRYLEDLPSITEDSLPGELANVISGRVANVFNVEGPNFTVDAACASSMAAVMNAAKGLRDGTIDYAITGGVDCAMHPSSFVKFCKIGALSPDGSRPFDQAANGFVMGEGAGIMILKRLSDAIRDNDRIYGTILAVGSSSDGRGKGITAPNAAGQERAVAACIEGAKISPQSIGLIEAHGTSTEVGDKTELTVLDKFFRTAGLNSGSVCVGSVKSQIGHLKAASGAAGMIKAVLSLHHKTLPPTINVRIPNPCISWESSPLRLNTEARPWEPAEGFPRRAGVSAFGFGGTNFHVALQEHIPGLRVISGHKKPPMPQVEVLPPVWPTPPDMRIQGEAWVMGGKDLADLADKIQEILREITPENWTRLAASQRAAAATEPIRCGLAGQDAESISKKLAFVVEASREPARLAMLPTRGIHLCEDVKRRSRTGPAFLFPGQGTQYPFMLRDLAERFPVVADTFAEADDILVSLGLPSVTTCCFPATGTEKDAIEKQMDVMKDTQLLQPMILAADTAMFRLLSQMGVLPVAVAGHSLGEYAACVAAGVFSFGDALKAVAVRGREMARVSIADPGLMMSVPADSHVVEDLLAQVDGYVVAANKNSPKQTVISGETLAVKKAGEVFRANGLEGTLLPVSAAFHSGVVAPAREPFMKTLERLTVNPPNLPVLSNVTGDFYPVGPAAGGKIRDLLGKQFAAPVEWVKSMRRLYSEGVRIFIECGPKRVMTNLVLDTLPEDVLALPTNHPKKGGILQLMETLAALVAEGVPVDVTAAESRPQERQLPVATSRPELRVVTSTVRETAPPPSQGPAERSPDPLESLLDPELREIAAKNEFRRFIELQGEPIRNLIKSGFHTFVKNVLPLDKTVKQVQSEGMDFKPVVVSGIAAGLPSDVRFPFDRETLDDLILGHNFIKKVPEERRLEMLEKNVERLFKGPSGEVELQVVDDISGVIKLAGYFNEEEVIQQYDVDERVARAMDVTTALAVAAGFEALRDAGIPLVRHTRTTSTGHELLDSWALPRSLQDETGVIFASAFPGMATLVDEVTRETAARFGAGAKKRLIEFYTGLIGRIRDDKEKERITRWFTGEFSRMGEGDPEELYTFNRDFLLKIAHMAHGQFAQLIKARGPNTHVDAACAGTTQAVLLARDWIRTGRARRVVVVAADDVAGKMLLPWVGAGFLAMGAATTNGNISEAALPFDDRRHGLILGSAAVGLVLESSELPASRGMESIASIEAGLVANSGFHGTRLDVEHISSLMQRMISKWEEQTGLSREDLVKDVFFMSHETYSPKRGGSSAAEVRALRDTFGDRARLIPISNTKGFTGHTMGVGVEDVVALRCLQKRKLAPIPNLKKRDPDFADLNLSRGGPCDANYALRLAAGFGSQIVMALYKVVSREENRITDLSAHRNWLKDATGYSDPVVTVEKRTLRVKQRVAQEVATGDTKRAGDVSTPERKTANVLSSPSGGKEEVRAKILALLSNKTGYPADMLDTGLDLEADLGIDTVKQAEFIAEVRDTFDLPRIEGLKIADFPTIEHIIKFVLQQSDRAELSAAGPDTAEQSVELPDDLNEVREKILTLLAGKTGYPADMLDPELDLEADLGIDTVKQAEFIAEVRETFSLPRIEGLKIADFPTINHIIGFVLERTSAAAAPESAEKTETHAEKVPVVEAEIRLFEARLVPVPDPQEIAAPEVDQVIVAGGPEALAETLQQAFKASGVGNVSRVEGPLLPEGLLGKRVGIVNLFPMDHNGQFLRESFELFLASAATFEQGPAFFVTVLSEDGAYGFESPTEEAGFCGAAAGATKSFAREYPETTVRVLDLHPDLTKDASVELILRSVRESFPLETAVAADGRLRAVRLAPTLDQGEEVGLKSGDVVLVSGGARGITAWCLRRFAEQRKLTFAILDLTALSDRAEEFSRFTASQWNDEKLKIVERFKSEGAAPTPVMVERELARMQGEAEAFGTVRDLRAAGSEVIYRSLDIRDGDAVDRALQDVAQLCGRVDIVIHAAGIDISRALRSKTLEQIETVVSVKLDGMKNLLEALDRRDLPPRRILGFGSVAGRFGNMAQIDYSAANDGLAHLLRRASREMDARVSIIDWAPWSGVGMAVRGSVQQTLEAAGIDFIPPEKGAELLLRELGRTSGGLEALAAGRLGPFTEDAFWLRAADEHNEAAFAGQRAQVLAMAPGEYVKARVFLDPTLPLLDHHRIDRAAVLPGVGAMAIMRAAATLLDPAAATADFEDVRFKSPLKIFRNDVFEAEVEVVRGPTPDDASAAYHAKISSWFVDKEGRKIGSPRVHHECRLVPRKDRQAVYAKFDPWRQSVRIVEEDVYALFFHGPGFKFLDHVAVEGNGKGVSFRYRETRERSSMFTDFIPSAVEAVFQAAAAFGLESRGIMTLPVGVGRATVYNTQTAPGDGLLTFVRQTDSDGPDERTSLTFDAVVRDRDGNVTLEIAGIEMVELGSSAGFPRRVFEEVLPVDEIVAESESGSGDFLKQVLDAEEIQEYGEKKVPKRAGEWLAGRVALKRSVQRLLAASGDRRPSLRSIRISSDDNGKPVAELSGKGGLMIGDVSLSHSNGLAIAAATAPGSFGGVGVDIERVEARSESWIKDYFTDEEIQSAGADESRWEKLTGIWCLKEAALKALGTGLRFDLKDVMVSHVDDWGQARVEFRNEAAQHLAEHVAGTVEARVETSDGIVTARVMVRRPDEKKM